MSLFSYSVVSNYLGCLASQTIKLSQTAFLPDQASSAAGGDDLEAPLPLMLHPPAVELGLMGKRTLKDKDVTCRQVSDLQVGCNHRMAGVERTSGPSPNPLLKEVHPK